MKKCEMFAVIRKKKTDSRSDTSPEMCTYCTISQGQLINSGNLDKTRVFRIPDKECINNPLKSFGGSVASFLLKGCKS